MKNKKSTPQVANILQAHGFILSKGDAAKVAEKATEMASLAGHRDNLSEEMIVDAALALNLPHNQKGEDKLSLLAADPLADALTDWIATQTAQALQAPDATKPLIKEVMRIAVHEHKSRIRVESTGWDCSTRGEKTRHLYDLAAYATIEDFLEEPTGETVATYMSGSGLSAELWREKIRDAANDIISDKLDAAVKRARTDAPEAIRGFIAKLDNDSLLDDFISEYVRDALDDKDIFDSGLVEAIENLPFRENLLKCYPEVEGRLLADIEKHNIRAQVEDKAREKLAGIKKELLSDLDGMQFNHDNYHELINKIVSYCRDAEGLVLTRLLAEDKGILALMSRSTRAEFAADMENWLGRISEAPDFENPVAQLFHMLTQAYFKDGRSWYVTIANDGFVSTYAQDNWAYLLASALSDTYWPRPYYLSVVLRRFEKLKDPDTHIPFKSVGGLIISDNDFQPVSREKMQVAINTDSHGKPLPKDSTVRVVDVKELVPELFTE